MFDKFKMLILSMISLIVMISVAEAKVCFLPNVCDDELAVQGDSSETRHTPTPLPSCDRQKYDLLTPRVSTETMSCNCESCEDDNGTYYACDCQEKPVPIPTQCDRQIYDLITPKMSSETEICECDSCEDNTGTYYACRCESPFCDRSQYPATYPQESNETQICDCDSCEDETGTYYTCSCQDRPDPCDGLPTEKPEDTDSIQYSCHMISGLSGNTCYDCEKRCTLECGCGEKLNSDTCTCEKISVTCENLCFKFKFTDYAPISKAECEAVKEEYGIKYCIDAEKDYFAGAVKTCGGIDEIPTEDEAFTLAKCMYNPAATYTSIYGTRDDQFFVSYGGKDNDLADHVFVWLNWEKDRDNRNSIVRMFDYDGSIPYFAEKDGSHYYIHTGATAEDWQNKSILSRTLCRVH